MKEFLFSLIDKAIIDYNMIEKGDRILIGASGGKDSTALAEYFSNRLKRKDADFEIKCVSIQSDFAPPFPENIAALFRQWNIEHEIIDADILARLKPGRKMNCFWCSMQRRMELLVYAKEHGYNKIALGHHLDDILETFLMNMLQKRELSTMPPILKYEKFPVTLIRPLCYADEKTIIEHGGKIGYLGWTCTCTYQDNSTRKTARKQIDFITEGDFTKKTHMIQALKNINKEYLP